MTDDGSSAAPPSQPDVASVAQPKCGHHPERDADGGTCERCGTFICAECVVEGSEPRICATCLKRLDAAPHLTHARVLGLVMMAHGALLAAMSAYYLIFGVVFASDSLPQSGEQPIPYFAQWLGAGMVFEAVVHVAPGVMNIIAGWQVFRFRGRTLALVAIALSALTVCGIYCAPTALFLAIYAIWVLTRDDVVARFAVVTPAAKQGA
ncbi:MAG: hypothetical protein AB7S26_17245 [Sandaracinaceae bacterium]